jgi:hypothetical protein
LLVTLIRGNGKGTEPTAFDIQPNHSLPIVNDEAPSKPAEAPGIEQVAVGWYQAGQS